MFFKKLFEKNKAVSNEITGKTVATNSETPHKSGLKGTYYCILLRNCGRNHS